MKPTIWVKTSMWLAVCLLGVSCVPFFYSVEGNTHSRITTTPSPTWTPESPTPTPDIVTNAFLENNCPNLAAFYPEHFINDFPNPLLKADLRLKSTVFYTLDDGEQSSTASSILFSIIDPDSTKGINETVIITWIDPNTPDEMIIRGSENAYQFFIPDNLELTNLPPGSLCVAIGYPENPNEPISVSNPIILGRSISIGFKSDDSETNPPPLRPLDNEGDILGSNTSSHRELGF